MASLSPATLPNSLKPFLLGDRQCDAPAEMGVAVNSAFSEELRFITDSDSLRFFDAGRYILESQNKGAIQGL